MKISWQRAGGPANFHFQQAPAESAGPSPLGLLLFFIIFVCQSSVRKGLEREKHLHTILFRVHSTREAGVCKHREEDSDKTHAAFQCCCAIWSKRHGAAVQAVSRPRSQNKQNSNQLTNDARCFLQSLSALGGLSRVIIHHSWSCSRATEYIQNTQPEEKKKRVFYQISLLISSVLFSTLQFHRRPNWWQILTVCFFFSLNHIMLL